jgi:hypothetical protein
MDEQHRGNVTRRGKTAIEFFHARKVGVPLALDFNVMFTPAAAEILRDPYWTRKINRGLTDARNGDTRPLSDYLSDAT